MILLLLFLQKQSLAFAVYLFGIGTLLTGLGSKKTHVIMFSPRPQRLPGDSPTPWYYCDNEELCMAYCLSIFTGDAASLARTALDDTSPSDHAGGVCVGEAVAHFTTPTYGP